MNVLDVVYDLCIMSALLLVAKVLRAKVRIIQRLYIPSALIAGALGLLLGKQGLGILPFSEGISSYSGILIVVLYASLYMGSEGKMSFRSMFNRVGDSFLAGAAMELSQYGLFILLGLVLPLIFSGLPQAFGLMLPAGYIGGHGSAAAIGSVLVDGGWPEAVSVGQTFATVGLLLGVIGGVVIINIGARRGYTKIIKSVRELPEEMLTGLTPAKSRQPLGEATVNPMSLDSITWHLTLLLVSVGSAYLVNEGLKKLLPNVSFPVFGLALVCSIVLQRLLHLLKMDAYVDKKTVTHLGSCSTDYLVAFGVASINISVILEYWVPLLLLALLGFAYVLVWFLLYPHIFRSFWFERGLYVYGMSTGVTATGVILLRIADPEFESGVLEDMGFAMIFIAVMDILVVSLSPMLLLQGMGAVCGAVQIGLALLCLVLCRQMSRTGRKE